MRHPEGHTKTGGRLSGYDIRQYLEDFKGQFLKGKIRFETEVLNIRRGDHERGWSVLVHDKKSTSADSERVRVLYYPRIVLCTGVSFIYTLWTPNPISAWSSGEQQSVLS